MVQKQKIYLEEKLKDLSALYDKYRLRLVEVRRNKLNKFSNFGDECDDRDDLFSDAGSTITKTSRSSRYLDSTVVEAIVVKFALLGHVLPQRLHVIVEKKKRRSKIFGKVESMKI